MLSVRRTGLGPYTQYQYQLKAILEAAEYANRIDNTGWLLDNYLFASLSRKLPAYCWFSSSELSMEIASRTFFFGCNKKH